MTQSICALLTTKNVTNDAAISAISSMGVYDRRYGRFGSDQMSTVGAGLKRSASSCAVCAAIVAVLLQTGCAREETVVGLELELLVEQQDNFLGRLIRTSGVVRMHDSPRHFWLEDDALNRVGLVPADSVEAWLGDEVEVVGRFGFAADTGRRVQVLTITRTTGDSS